MAQPNWWEQDEIVQPAPQAGPIRSPVDPYKQAADARAARDQQIQEQRLVMDQAKIAADQEAQAKEQAEKDAKLARSQSSASLSLSSVLDKIDNIDLDVRDNGGWGETGKTGDWARRFIGSGTAGYDLAENIKTIDANSAFAALQQMRDNSPTGGALGQVTEKELDLLKSQISSLDPNQSQEQFLENLAIARSTYLDMLRRVDPAAAEAYEAKTTQDQGGDIAPQAGLTGRVTDDSPADTPPTSPPPPGGGNVMSDLATGVGQSVGDVIQAGGDMAGLVINPAHAAINAVTGAGLTTDFGSYLRDDLLGISHGNPTAEAITRGATAAFTGAGAARGIASALTPGLARNALATVGATPAIDAAAGAGAGLGGDLGARSGIPGGELIGTLAGGIGGFGAASRAAATGAPRQMNALAQAAERQGVDLLPADAGGRVSQMVTSGAKASPISAGPVVKASQRAQEQVRGAVNRVRDDAGQALESDAAGNAVRSAAQRFTKQTSQRGSQLYDRANSMARGVRIKPNTAVQTLDGHIARLSELEGVNGPMIKSLTTLRDDIANGVSVNGLRDARTSLSQGVYDGKLRSNQEKQVYREVLDALSTDIEQGLRSVGRDNAADAFKRADAFWRERVQHIDEVLQPILGKDRSGEDIVKAVETMARGGQGGNARLSRLLANMTDQEAGNIRATIIDRIGKANPGAQSAEGDVFSPATFLTNWNKMTPQAKASLFSDKGMRESLNDIAKLAEGMKTSQSMANHSNTALAVGSNVGAGLAVATASPLAVALGAGAQFITGKLMASPRFARALAKTAEMPPRAAQRKFTEELGILATREPLLAADAKALQQHLAQSFGQSPVRAAANEKEQN